MNVGRLVPDPEAFHQIRVGQRRTEKIIAESLDIVRHVRGQAPGENPIQRYDLRNYGH